MVREGLSKVPTAFGTSGARVQFTPPVWQHVAHAAWKSAHTSSPASAAFAARARHSVLSVPSALGHAVTLSFSAASTSTAHAANGSSQTAESQTTHGQLSVTACP